MLNFSGWMYHREIGKCLISLVPGASKKVYKVNQALLEIDNVDQ